MKNVIILGDSSKGELTGTIVGACSRYGGALVTGSKGVLQTGSEPAFCIICADRVQELDCTGVLVFGESFRTEGTEYIRGPLTAVTDSSNADALSVLRRSDAPVIGCSMCGYDTLSLSCTAGSSMLVCLQRSITTLSGRVIEPCEIRLRTARRDSFYSLLAACAVLLLHDVPADNGYEL